MPETAARLKSVGASSLTGDRCDDTMDHLGAEFRRTRLADLSITQCS